MAGLWPWVSARAAAKTWTGQLQGRILGQLQPTPFTRTGNGHKSQGRKTVISRGRGNPGAKRRVQEKLLQLRGGGGVGGEQGRTQNR